MTVQLTLSGNHATDLLSEILTLARVIAPEQPEPTIVQQPVEQPVESKEDIPVEEESKAVHKSEKKLKVKVPKKTKVEVMQKITTPDSLRNLISSKTADPNSDDYPMMLQGIRDILAGYTKEGDEPKVSNLPDDVIEEVYEAIDNI